MSISKTRQRLLETARVLFAKQGLGNTTMNDIATASEKGRRTLYTYFRNKEEIYFAVIEMELNLLSDEMSKVKENDKDPDEKIIELIETHLKTIKNVVTRNGNLRAEFFRNIWHVERMRKAFDLEERKLFIDVLKEGCDKGLFWIDDIKLMADIFHYSLKGLEVPYIYGRLGKGLAEINSHTLVTRMVRRLLGAERIY